MQKRSVEDWRQLFNEHAHSGQSAATFCRARGICAKHFSKRRKQLLRPDAVRSLGAVTPPSAFVAVTVDRNVSSVQVELHVGNNIRLRFPGSVSPTLLANVIQHLRQ